MPQKEQINTNQFIWMLFIIITSVSVLTSPGILLMIGHRDVWMSVIGGVILDVLLAIVYAYLGMRFPTQNFVQYSSAILGNKLGKLVGICFPLFFLFSASLVTKSLSTLINTAFLPKTPMLVISISGYIVIAYAARRGVEVIGRVAEMLGPLYLASAIMIAFFLFPAAEINRLQPVLESGVVPVVRGSFYITNFYGICIIMAMFIPISNRPEKGFFAKVCAVSMGGLMMGIVCTFSVMVFGYQQAINKISPSLALTRSASLGHFFERFEIVWMLIAVGAGIIASTQMVWAFSVGVSQTFGLPNYKSLVVPACFLSVILEITSFKNLGENAEFLHYTYPSIAMFVETVLEVFLLIAAVLLKKRAPK